MSFQPMSFMELSREEQKFYIETYLESLDMEDFGFDVDDILSKGQSSITVTLDEVIKDWEINAEDSGKTAEERALLAVQRLPDDMKQKVIEILEANIKRSEQLKEERKQ